MPPILASFLTVAFIVFLFRRDFREKPNVSGAVWLPTLWMLIIASRAVSEWLNLFGLHMGGVAVEEGSPLDASVYYTLILAALYVLNRRRISLAEIFRNNGWLVAFLLYCFLAIFWSDFPFVSLKRWTKVIGHPIMVLILFTEPDPEEALRRLMKRCAYIILPVSILFIKYYPQWGRGFSDWTGEAFNTGITTDKNALGYDCLILGFFLFWHFLQTWRSPRNKARRNELLLTAGLIYMIWWLLSMARSSTSTMSLLLGVLIVALLGLRSLNMRFVGAYVLGTIIVLAAAEWGFGIFEGVTGFLGKDSTLTGRTDLWQELLEFDINPIFGRGFESFWLGERLRSLAKAHWWHPNEAHNGYLETYLNLGLIGLFMLIGLLIATFRKIRRELLQSFEWGRYRLGFFTAVIVYNWTESSFKTLHPIWFAFYIIAMDYPQSQFVPVEQSAESSGSGADGEPAYAEVEALDQKSIQVFRT